MGSDDAVVIQVGKRAGEATVITVNCPDKTGLGCDLCRTILEFGLRISRAGESGPVLLPPPSVVEDAADYLLICEEIRHR